MSMLRKARKTLYAGWMKFAAALAYINTRIVLTLVFVLLIGPLALVMRILGKDFLDRRMDRRTSFWKTRMRVDHTLENMKHQF